MKKFFIITLFISLGYFVNAQTLPTTSDNTVSTSEDLDRVFGVVDFPFVDPDVGASLWQIRITNNVTTGTLYDDSNLNGVIDGGEALGAGSVVLVSNFNRFKFKPLPDQNGVGYDQFDFQVHDGADGWSILPASTMTIDVTAVNDDPVVTTNTGKTVAEGATNQVIAQAELETTDLEQAPASLTYTLNSIPFNGTLTNGGPPLGIGGTFTQADINAGNVEYNHDGSETNSDAFTFSVDDGAGGSTPVTAFSITVTPVNDPPVLVNNTGKTVNEGAANQIIPNTELLVTDVDNTNAQIEYTLTTIPTNGTLFCGGALGLGSTFTQANINANMLQYTHDGSETVADLFRFTVSDGAGGSIGVTQFDITINPQNDDPVVTTNTGKTVTEGATNQTILNTELETTDAESGPALLTYTLSAVPANGTITNGGPPLGIGGTFTQLNINSNNVEYNHDGSETISDSFTFTVDDGTGGTTVATVFVITITPVNDAPVLALNTGKTVNEGANNQIILNTELRVTDVDNTDAQIEFTLTFLPLNGTLYNNAVPLVLGNTFTQTDINLNNINYSHDGTETVTDFFRFTVSDGAGGNIPQTQFDFTITPLNDDPVVTTNNGKTVAEGAVNQTIVITDLETTDTDNTPAQLTYTVSAVPAHGNITNSGVPIPALGTFTQLDINSNNIEYDHDGSEPNADSFTFTVDDGAGGTTAATTFNITITPVNDAPVLATNNPLNINEGDINQGIPNTLLQVTDVDNTPAEIEFTLTTAPASGTLYLSGVPVAVAGTFTQAQIDANAITYSHDGTETVTDFFRFTVNDGAGGNIGVTQFDINIAPVNDAPVFDTSPVTVGAELVLYTYNISASDPDHPGPALSFAAVTIPPWLALVDHFNGTATLSGTPPGGAPLNNPIRISVTDGTETVLQIWNLMITSGVTANAGLDDTTCVDDSYILNGNPPPSGYTGLWTVIDGAGVFVDETLYNTQVDGLNSGVAPNNSNTFRWTLSNADGSYVVWDDVVIINNTVISEVTDISNVCGTNAILQADNALFPGESGLWTVEGSPVPLPVIANPTQRTTAVSGLNYNVNQFRWTVTKETCSDFAIMTVDVIEVWATAGGPAEICSEPFTIYGNDPALLGGTGLWTVGAGGGTFANANNPTTTVTNSWQNVPNQYIWTVTVNGCSDQASVFVENNIPSTATITTPDPSTSCDGTYTIVAVPADATDPNETGFWTTVTPGVIIATPNNATTNVSNLQQGANLFTWHITNGNCPESTADLTINYFLPAVVNAGPDDIICTDIYNLAATPLNPGETGLWTVVVGGGTFLDPTSSNTQVINIQRGLNTFQWTVNHDICSNSDMVDITNLSVDAVISNPDPEEVCVEPHPIQGNNPAFYDLANPPTVTTGLWTVQSGSGIVTNPLDFNTTVSNLDPGNNNLIWTLDNGTCSDSDTLTLINNIATVADAGRDTIVCSYTLPNLNGNNNYDHFRETGFWRRIAGNATITDPTLFNSSVTNLDLNCTPWTPDWYTGVNAVNVFEWVIRRGSCESTDQVRVLNGLPEVPDAGIDQTVCDNVVNLDALDEGSCTQSTWWEEMPNTGDFYDPLTGNPIADYTEGPLPDPVNMPFNIHVEDIQNGMTQFVWHKKNEFQYSDGTWFKCELTDTVEITSLGDFEDVQAGTNDAVCENEYQLNATDPNSIFNTPPHVYYTTGQWSVTFGNGNFDDPTFYNTWVRNMAAYDNIYRWTITNHDLNCIMSDDIWIHSARPSDATAGPDDVTCNDFAVLSSNVPARFTNAYWTVEVGGATIIDNSCTGFACNAMAINIADSLNIFVWHVTNEYTGPHGGYTAGSPLICSSIDSTVIIYRGVNADAGVDLYACADFQQLNANDPEWESGLWTGSGTFESSGTNTSTLFNDIVHGLTPGKNTFTWTISNEACSGSDQLVVWGLLPPTPFANVDQTGCTGDVNLNANDVSNYWSVVDPVPPNPVWQEATATGYWTTNTPGVTFDNISNFNTTAHNVPANGSTPTMFVWHSLNNFTDHVAGLDYQCELTDTMFYYNHAVTSIAGSDGQVCGIQGVGAVYTLGATPVTSPQTGIWTTVFAPGATIVNNTQHDTQVTGMLNGDHVYRWTVSHWLNSNECTADDFVTVEVRIPTPVVIAPPSTYEICEDFTTLQANQPNYTIGETGLWTDINDPAATIVDPTSEVTMVTGIGLGTRMFEWRITNDFCDSTGIITVYNNMILADADDRIDEDAILHGVADNDSAVCQNWYDLSATDPNIYNTGTAPIPAGVWTALPGTVTFDNITLYNTTVRNLNDIGTNISNLTWTITKGGCVEASILDITNNEFIVDADVNTNPNLLETCDGDILLAGEQPGAVGDAYGYWTIVSGGGNIQVTSLYNTMVTDLPANISIYQWNVSRFGCDAIDQVTVDNNEVTSNAGPDFSVCSDVATLNGGVPAYADGETGQWFPILGGGTVTDPTLFNSGVTNMAQGQNRFRWTITNGNCFADDVVEIINNEPDDFTVEADKEVCNINSTVSVNPAPAIGSGLWTMLAGGMFTAITDDTAINTAVTDLQPGSNIFLWTVNNLGCPKEDQIEITNNMVISEAGIAQDVCADTANLLAADPDVNFPFQGTGTWTVITGASTVVDLTAYDSHVTDLDPGLNTFRWTMTLGTCIDTDDADITNNGVIANATDQISCDNTATFDGNNPGSADGLWTVVGSSGTPNIVTPTLNISNVTDLGFGINTFRWLVDNTAGCSDSIDIQINNEYFTISAGSDQNNLCDNFSTLNGDEPGSGNPGISGNWVVVAGTGTVTNPTLYNSGVTGLSPGNNTFRWVVNSSICSAFDEVILINNSPTTAVITTPILANREICTNSLPVEGTNPVFGDGEWTISTAGASFVDPTDYQTVVNNLDPGNNIITWTITNGACVSFDVITVTNNEVAAVAGSDQPNLCADNTFLNATDPLIIYPFQGTGHWTNLSGNTAVLVNSMAENSQVTNLPIGTTVFEWTVEKGICSQSDQVQITNNSVTASATDQADCVADFVLNGNDPSTFGGTGLWEIIAGIGTITPPNTLFNTTITGVPNSTTSTLRWTVDNGICTDDILIHVYNNNFNLSAGVDVNDCKDDYTFSADDPSPGSGWWEILGGSGIIDNSTSHVSYVHDLNQGANVFRWHVSKNGCDNWADVTINNNNPDDAVITAPGINAREICNDFVTIQANDPSMGTGNWSVTDGAGTFHDASDFSTLVTGLTPGINKFLWTITEGSCSTSAEIIITNNMVAAEAGSDDVLCESFTNLNATPTAFLFPFQGTGAWSTSTAGVIIANSLSETTAVSNLPNGNITFYWTVTEGICSITDNVVISNYSAHAWASDAQTCDGDVTLLANEPSSGESGVWTCSTFGVTFDANTLYNTGAHNLVIGNNSFEWTIDNGDCSDIAVINVTYIDPVCDAGGLQNICDDYTFLAAQDPAQGIAQGTGTWFVKTGTGTFTNSAFHNTFVSGISAGTNVYEWTVNDRGCIEIDTVTVINNLPVAIAGSDVTTCYDYANLNAIQEQIGETANWSVLGGTGNVTFTSLYNSAVTNLSSGKNVFQWTVNNGLCISSDEVSIYNNEITSISAGVDNAICSSSTTLAALAPGTGETGSWDALSGSAIFDNSALYNTGVSNLSQGDNILQWTLTNGTCSDADNVTITNNSPTTPSTSPDDEICSSTYTLLANAPNTGVGETGLWTNEFGAVGVIVEPTDNITTVHSVGHGSNTFRWTISNALCNAYDDIVITNNTISTDAGLDQSRCSDTAVLAATNPAPGTGYWEMVNPLNGPVFDNSLAYNTVIRNLAQGNNILVWTATNSGCTAWDLVTISNDNPTIADAGIDQTVCNSTATLSGNNPSVGTGVWTRLGGAGVIANPSHNNTNVTGLSAGGNTFRWTITEGSCESYDDILIMNELVYASAGIDDEICGNFYPELNGNQPGEGETGEWTVTSGLGVFADATLYNTSVSGLSVAENRFTWTVSKGECSNSDDVSIFDNTPSTASVSSDKEICDDYTVIAGNPPAIGVGEWSVAAGTGDFDNSLDNTTFVRNIVTEINIYRWTITNGICTSSADIAVTYNGVSAVVGDSIFECGTTTYLNGNEPQDGQTGLWTTTGPGVIIVNPTRYNTAVLDLNVGINKFRWTINFGICSDYADLVVTNDLYDANASVAGPDTICVDYADLLGNIPPPGATGEWSVWAGGGTFDDPASPTAEVTGLLRGENTLRWTITKNDCSNYDDVVITNNMVTALVGDDIITCGNDANLVANELYPEESGLWTKTAACGTSTILSPSTNETVVTGLCYGVNGFRWTVNGNGCSAWDEITVYENSFNIVAGFDKHVCDTTVALEGEDPAPGTGIWSFSGPGVTIVNPTLNTTVVNGLQDNSPHTFRWTVYKKGCYAWDEVIIYNDLVTANAGDDQSVCTPNAVLSATEPDAGTGYWTITTGAGEVTDPTYHKSTVTELGLGNNTLIWTVTNLACFDSDDVTIINNMVTATAGEDQQICENFTNLAGDPPQDGGYGIWEPAGGTGIVQTPTAYNSYVYNLQRGFNTFRWTVYQNDCSNGGDLVQIINNSFVANAGSDQILPLNQTYTNFDAELLPGQTGQWSISSGSGNIAEYNSPTSYVDNMFTGDNEFTWTVSEVINPSLTCTGTDDVLITVSDLDVQCGEDQINCVDTAKMDAEYEFNVDPNNHVWTKVNGSGVFDDIHDPKTVVRNIGLGTSTYRWTVYYTGFEVSCTVNITNDSIYVGAGDDAESCEDYHTMNAQPIIGGTGMWTIVGIGGGTIADNTLNNTEITSLEPGTNMFEWYTKRTYSGCESRDTVQLRYNLAPISDFEASPTEFCAPAWVTINNTSSNYPGWDEADVYEWSVTGDEGWFLGETYSVDEDLIREFTNTGTDDSTYHIQLVAIDTITGCSDTIVHSITAFHGPKVEFTPSSHEKRFPDANFQFDNKSDEDLISYHWDFGDGENIYQADYVGYVDHEYGTWGTYIITLTGISGGQCDGQYIDTVVVLPPCPNSNDVGSIIAKGCQPLTVEFNSNIHFADSIQWDFGDHSDLSNAENPLYTYEDYGKYIVIVNAWNKGCDEEAYERKDTVIVYPKPIVDFDVSPRLIMIPNQAIHCYNYSEFGNRYLWDFGDTISFDKEPMHYYTVPGIYDITLSVWTEHDCFDSTLTKSMVFAEEPGMIRFPNAFTPNPYGASGGVYPCTGNRIDTENLNDVFYPLFSGVVDYQLEIYNRWGEKIFITNDICIGWDGYVDGVMAPQDVYVWKVSVVYMNGEPYKEYGSVTLLR